MIRTQIQLTEEQFESLKRLARQEDLAVAAIIRTAVQDYLDREQRGRSREGALAVVGRFESDLSDVAQQHDEHLAEIYGDFNR